MRTQRNVIAIIDDDSVLRDALGNMLSSLGFRTELYASAEEFIRMARKTEASCLVIDIQLGDISGVELGRHLSANGFTFPIIFITGSQDETLRRQAMDLGAVAYLHKPFPAYRLVEAIASATGPPIRKD
jgi:FixJ family two-component response regulator